MDGVRAALDAADTTDASSANLNRYGEWYSAWGSKLKQKWLQEHPRAVPIAKPKNTKTVSRAAHEEPKGPCRVVEEVSEMSGW
jgi:hypothetical protein